MSGQYSRVRRRLDEQRAQYAIDGVRTAPEEVLDRLRRIRADIVARQQEKLAPAPPTTTDNVPSLEEPPELEEAERRAQERDIDQRGDE